jgi:two-component system, chemotaxis family, chemotaxis protein CheY
MCYQELGARVHQSEAEDLASCGCPAAELSSPITLLRTQALDLASTSGYSTRLLNRVSAVHLPATRITAQAPGILVVDDEWEIRNLVSETLSSKGYLVLPATNGAEALAVMDGARVSLALLDMRMPVLDGWGFARELRARRSWLPVIVMSAAVNAQQWADEIGAAGSLSKPFDLLELLATVERLVAPN